jgi:putative Holliday junction resolvase
VPAGFPQVNTHNNLDGRRLLTKVVAATFLGRRCEQGPPLQPCKIPVSKRKAGLDIGDKRIGVSVSDALGMTAQPLGTVERRSMRSDITSIMALLVDYEVEAFVVGLPLRLDGSEGEQADKVRHFAERIEAETGLPVFFQDERLTSSQGERMMIEAGVSRAKRRSALDRTAAALILQAYLDMNPTEDRR